MPLPSSISCLMRRCEALSGSYLSVISHSYAAKVPPLFSTRLISLYTAVRSGAWQVASMAYAASKLPFSIGSFMKSAFTKLHRGTGSPPAPLQTSPPVISRARFTWYALLLMPVTDAPLKALISRAGPPTPQPRSATLLPAPMPSFSAR